MNSCVEDCLVVNGVLTALLEEVEADDTCDAGDEVNADTFASNNESAAPLTNRLMIVY
jgi:hypothetical protein